MPAKKYAEAVRLSQRWPGSLLRAVEDAAARRGWNASQWLQEAARGEIRRQEAREVK